MIKKIGLLGGAGCGKSFFADYLKERYDAAVIDGDKVGHELLAENQSVKYEIVDRFGSGVLDDEGKVDRKVLGNIVFGNREAMASLNAIMHPRMKEAIDRKFKALADAGVRIALLDAAVMIEAGFTDLVDKKIYVTADDALRLERLTGPRGIPCEKARMMIASGRNDYDLYADYTIDSSKAERDNFQLLDDIIKKILEDEDE